MHPLLLIGFLVVAVGVFAQAAGENSGTKVVKFTPKKKKAEGEEKPEGKPAGASDSEE
jgi:hypothetical protein